MSSEKLAKDNKVTRTAEWHHNQAVIFFGEGEN